MPKTPPGQIGILNVGAGDTKLVFDKTNPAECIRSARIVTDMLRRGYALLVEEPDGAGGTRTVRAHAFREDVCEYVIADYAPEITEPEPDDAIPREDEHAQDPAAAEGTPATEGAAQAGEATPRRGRRILRTLPAAGTSGIAVARIAGG